VKAGLPIVWVPCMSYLFSSERRALNRYGPFTRYVFHSQYQRAAVGGQLQALGVEPQRFAVIRGAFCLDDWPYCPRAHAPDSEFFIGRLSRSDRRKFPADLWTIYEPIPRRRARVMGVTDPIARYLGPAPDWAETLPPKAEPADRFLAGLHAMVMPGGEAVENWPRVGLEAMAAGVPIIADGTGGWPEMIDHGRTGYLCRSPGEFAEHAALLAENESLRLAIAARARTALETDLADPDLLIAAWQRVFDGL
jgi:glycosyltransferase involved in cell wall biosynthesis